MLQKIISTKIDWNMLNVHNALFGFTHISIDKNDMSEMLRYLPLSKIMRLKSQYIDNWCITHCIKVFE